jgi:hypothetical protein
MATKTDMTVANTIRDQLGHRCLYMLGAKNLAGDSTSLRFKIGQNNHGVNWIKISLNGMDLYDMTFMWCRPGRDGVVKSEVSDIYAEDLHSVIESETGMRTTL